MSSRRPVVLVARYDDPHLELIRRHAADNETMLHVIELGHPADEYVLTISIERAELRWRESTITAALARDATLISLPFAVNQPPLVVARSNFGQREWNSSLESILEIWGSMNPDGWMIHPSAILLQDRKPYLLWMAAQQSIATPTWVISRDPAMFVSAPVVGKAINAWQHVTDGQNFTTRRISPELRSRVGTNTLETPAYTQSFVPHDDELRIYASRGRAVAVKFRSRQGVVVPDDYRTGGSAIFTCELHDPPEALTQALLRLTETLRLKFCVFDIAVAGNQHFLLDVNPVGSWAYIVDQFDLDITSAILEPMLEETDNRGV
jgi:hypothetical protein